MGANESTYTRRVAKSGIRFVRYEIKRIAKVKGMSLSQLADRAGIRRIPFYAMIYGFNHISVADYFAILKVLWLGVDDLAGGGGGAGS